MTRPSEWDHECIDGIAHSAIRLGGSRTIPLADIQLMFDWRPICVSRSEAVDHLRAQASTPSAHDRSTCACHIASTLERSRSSRAARDTLSRLRRVCHGAIGNRGCGQVAEAAFISCAISARGPAIALRKAHTIEMLWRQRTAPRDSANPRIREQLRSGFRGRCNLAACWRIFQRRPVQSVAQIANERIVDLESNDLRCSVKLVNRRHRHADDAGAG